MADASVERLKDRIRQLEQEVDWLKDDVKKLTKTLDVITMKKTQGSSDV
jgi:prefoldin subunit 5